jgi:hypothetical protein
LTLISRFDIQYFYHQWHGFYGLIKFEKQVGNNIIKVRGDVDQLIRNAKSYVGLKLSSYKNNKD